MNVSWTDTISCSLPLAHSILLLTVNAIVGVLGSLGNWLVCLAIATNSRLRRSSNYLLFSLAIAYLIVTLICEPIVLEFISQLTFFHKSRTSQENLCTTFWLVFHARLHSSIWFRSELIVSLPLHFHCVTKSLWKKADLRLCS